VFFCAIVLVVGIAAYTQRAQNITVNNMKPKSIPELEAERIARDNYTRTDTGRLTVEDLAQNREIITTSSTRFVMEGVNAASFTLPITGERAKIGFFSPQDGNLDVTLADPNGKF